MNRKNGFTLVELLVAVGIIGIISSIAALSINTIRMKTRDTRRIEDLTTIRTALESFFENTNRLPNNTENDDGGWDIGNIKLPRGNTFIRELQDTGALRTVPTETYLASGEGSYRYFKYENEQNCGGTFAILAVKLEGRKQNYNVSNTLEGCYTANFNAVPINDYWLSYMIREL